MNGRGLLRRLLDLAGGPAEKGYVLALDAPALADVEADLQTERARYHVFRPRSELALRRVVWQMGEAPFLAIIKPDLASRLPPDLIRRARGSVVHALEARDLLSLALGVNVVMPDDPALQDLLVERVDALHDELSRRTLPTVVGRDLLEQLLLEVVVGAEIRDSSAEALLARWLETPPSSRWPAPIRELVRRHLPRLQGGDGAVLAWALDDPALLRELVVRGLLLAVEDDVEELPPAIWGERLKPLLADPAHGFDRPRLRKLLVRLAVGVCDALGDKARGILEEAEIEAREKLRPSQLSRSTVLPLGLENRMAELAHKVASGGVVTASEVSWLEEHRAARFHEPEIKALEQMARLSRYLGAELSPEGAAPNVVDRVLAYQRQGAFADLTAARLRRTLASTSKHHAEARVLLERWRERRDAENLAFAQALAGGYERALFAEGVTSLPRVWRHHALPELTRGADEHGGGLYLVVLDGCSYPVFLELVFELARLPHPIGFRSLEGSGEARGLPALSPLPTITCHSRGALFLGEIPKDPLVPEALFRDRGEGETDPARFARNPDLGDRPRRLFLKGQLADGGGALLSALGDRQLAVVAAVFNAVDDLIGSSSTGVAFELGPQSIAGFIPSLRKAFEAGRRVLLTADHGFSPFLSTELRVGSAKGGEAHRYLELQAGESAPPGFIELDLAGLGGQPDTRRAFAWKVGAYLLKKPQVGFHGGCGLEEMVVPLAWLVADGLPPDLPSWWVDVQASAALTVSSPRPASQKLEVQRQDHRQGDLFHEPSGSVDSGRPLVDLGVPSDVVSSLDEAQRKALAKLADVGTARATDLAKALGKPPGRIRGFMAKLQRQLHGAGLSCLRHEELPDGEVQYAWVSPIEGGGTEP